MFWPYFYWHLHHGGRAAPRWGCSFPRSWRDAKTAANFVPLVLIPQLIFGGALIKYDEMNRNLDIDLHVQALASTAPERDEPLSATTPSCSIPLISRFVATHYSATRR